MSNDNGGPAFPYGKHGTHFGGMSLRDYFAAKAMQAIISSEELMNVSNTVVETGKRRDDWVSEQSYCFADAMLKARQQ